MNEVDGAESGNRAQRRAAGRRSKKMMAVSSGAVLVAGVAGPGVLLSQSVASAETMFEVTSLADAGPGTLRQAILDANANSGEDTITFATELSGLTIEVGATGLPPVDDAVAIVGPGADLLTIDGGGTPGDGDGVSIFYFDNITDGTIAVSGLTLTGGYQAYGGAIRVYEGYTDVNLTDLVITANEAEYYGGGVAINTTGVATIDNTEISDNLAGSGGGGLYADFDEQGSLSITNSLVTGNTADSSKGGGLYVAGGDFLLENSTISGNSADSDGGGGAHFYGTTGLTFTMRNSTVSGNFADNNYGGGLYLSGYGSSVIENSTISGNRANQAGAVYGGDGHSVTIVQTTITDNTATGEDEASPPLVGGVQLAGGGESVGTAKSAESEKEGRPSRPAAAAAGELEVVGTILAGNSGQDIGIYSEGDPTVTSDHSILGVVDPGIPVTDVGGTQFDVTDPGVAPLASNGGPTQTHALLDGSVALNAGPDPVPSFPGNEYDQRGPGFARVAFGFVDVGAFEAQEDEPVVPPPAPEPDAGPADAILVTPAFTG